MSTAALRTALRRSGERFALIFSSPVRVLRRRVDAWILARAPRTAPPVTLDGRRIYILPTRAGIAFAVMLLVMLLGAMNYSNSMAFALTFLLTGLGLLAMHHTHANLVRLRLVVVRAQPVFAGQAARFDLELENPSPRTRYAVAAAWAGEPGQDWTDVPAGGTATARLSLPAPRRGWLFAPRIEFATAFPLGLFRAWTWLDIDCRALVYPRPAPPGTAPPASAASGTGHSSRRAGLDEFAGLRGYQRGDPASRIHWKSAARLPAPAASMLQVKQFQEALDPSLWLDWNALPPAWGVEQRLEQLVRWLLDAERGGQSYGLRLPDAHRAPARGDAHRLQCLQMLALFGD